MSVINLRARLHTGAFRALLLSLLVITSLLPSVAQEESADRWLMFYHKNPSPEKLSAQVRELANKGVLRDEAAHPPVIAFLSQVMAQNPARVSGWLKEFEDLEEKQRVVLQAAAWYSDTEEARQYFKDKSLDHFLKKKAPKITEMTVDNPSVLDMQWGHFSATGDIAAIRTVISAFSLSKHAGAIERFKSSQKTAKDRSEAMLDATFQAAQWSLHSNCLQHPLVLEHCDTLLAEGRLPEDQQLWLTTVLSKINPAKYRPAAGSKKPKTEA
jgi:hypothetical protein